MICSTSMRQNVSRTRLDPDVIGSFIDTSVSSVSIARIEDGAIVFSAVFGSQSPGRAATPATLYNIASMTKPISAEVVLRLASSRNISLDEPIYPYWIDSDIAKDDRHKLLTPRIALSHQTGFPNWRAETGGVLAFNCTPGSAYTYSGEGYEYLARFVEKKIGVCFEDLAQSLVLDPAGMQDTSYTKRAWFRGRVAFPTTCQGISFLPVFAETLLASHLMYTTTTDYANFMLSLMTSVGVTADVASERSTVQLKRKACSSTLLQAEDSIWEFGYGLGWEIMRFRNRTVLWHRGTDYGVFTIGYFSPSSRTGTIIFTNSANGARVLRPVMEGLAEDPAFIDCFLARARIDIGDALSNT
jgi:CubicO group peptidase (beta-lactamase class C family)